MPSQLGQSDFTESSEFQAKLRIQTIASKFIALERQKNKIVMFNKTLSVFEVQTAWASLFSFSFQETHGQSLDNFGKNSCYSMLLQFYSSVKSHRKLQHTTMLMIYRVSTSTAFGKTRCDKFQNICQKPILLLGVLFTQLIIRDKRSLLRLEMWNSSCGDAWCLR